MKTLILLLLLVSSNASAYELAALNATFAALLIADRIQTEKIVNSNTATESNIVMGDNPSIKTQNLYFASSYVIVTAISYSIPRKYAVSFMAVANSFQISHVIGNYSIGFNIKY